MNLNKLQAAYRLAARLAADTSVEPCHRAIYQLIAERIFEGAGLSAPATAGWQEVFNHLTAERLVVANGRATLQSFDFDIDLWASHESDELPIDPDRLKRWLQGWSEESVAQARLLLEAQSHRRAA